MNRQGCVSFGPLSITSDVLASGFDEFEVAENEGDGKTDCYDEKAKHIVLRAKSADDAVKKREDSSKEYPIGNIHEIFNQR